VSFGCAILMKMFASFSIALIVSFVTSLNGAGGGGSVKAFVSFVAAMIILSVCVSAGELHFVGKNYTVSDIISPPVSVMYTL
jgi:formiminotetrahydrofolate cyclodeaminase